MQYVNPAFERLTGYWRSEVVGHPQTLVMNSEHEKPVSSKIKALLSTLQTLILFTILLKTVTM